MIRGEIIANRISRGIKGEVEQKGNDFIVKIDLGTRCKGFPVIEVKVNAKDKRRMLVVIEEKEKEIVELINKTVNEFYSK